MAIAASEFTVEDRGATLLCRYYIEVAKSEFHHQINQAIEETIRKQIGSVFAEYLKPAVEEAVSKALTQVKSSQNNRKKKVKK
jgi:hypothetical protein